MDWFCWLHLIKGLLIVPLCVIVWTRGNENQWMRWGSRKVNKAHTYYTLSQTCSLVKTSPSLLLSRHTDTTVNTRTVHSLSVTRMIHFKWVNGHDLDKQAHTHTQLWSDRASSSPWGSEAQAFLVWTLLLVLSTNWQGFQSFFRLSVDTFTKCRGRVSFIIGKERPRRHTILLSVVICLIRPPNLKS